MHTDTLFVIALSLHEQCKSRSRFIASEECVRQLNLASISALYLSRKSFLSGAAGSHFVTVQTILLFTIYFKKGTGLTIALSKIVRLFFL